MVAPPRAGKSVYCKQWQSYTDYLRNINCEERDELFAIANPRAVVSQDAIRYTLHGEIYRKEAEPMVFTIADYMAKSLLITGHDVLMDETSTSIDTVKRYIRLDREAKPIFLDYDVEVCKNRAITNAQEYLIPVIERCHKQCIYLKDNWNEIYKQLTS